MSRRPANTAETLAQLQKAISLAQQQQLGGGGNTIDTTALALELQRIEEALLDDKRRASHGGSSAAPGQASDKENGAARSGSKRREGSSGRQPSVNNVLVSISDIPNAASSDSTSGGPRGGLPAASCSADSTCAPSLVLMTPAHALLPSHSFAEAFVNDDRARLIFRIDALTNELAKERLKNKTLTRDVIPVLTGRVEDLEREVTLLRDRHGALATAAREAAVLSTAEEAAGVGPVMLSLQGLEEQLQRLATSW
jgi:hypothetical protein